MSSYWTETKMSITWCSSQKRKVQRCFCKLPSWSPAAYRWVRTTAVLLAAAIDVRLWYVLLLWISGQSTQTSIQELAQKVRTKNLVHSHWIARERPSKWMDWILANSNITSKCFIKKKSQANPTSNRLLSLLQLWESENMLLRRRKTATAVLLHCPEQLNRRVQELAFLLMLLNCTIQEIKQAREARENCRCAE